MDGTHKTGASSAVYKLEPLKWENHSTIVMIASMTYEASVCLSLQNLMYTSCHQFVALLYPHPFATHSHHPHISTKATMPTVTDSLSKFVTSVIDIFTAFLNSIFAVFQSLLALAQNIITSAVQVVQSLVALVLDLTQGVVGFAIGTFLHLSRT